MVRNVGKTFKIRGFTALQEVGERQKSREMLWIRKFELNGEESKSSENEK